MRTLYNQFRFKNDSHQGSVYKGSDFQITRLIQDHRFGGQSYGFQCTCGWHDRCKPGTKDNEVAFLHVRETHDCPELTN